MSSPPPTSPLQQRAVATTAEDVQNLEHLGEWDHGVEPDASGSPAVPKSSKSPPLDETFKRENPNVALEPLAQEGLVHQAQTAVSHAFHNVADKTALLKQDVHFKNEVEGHTEEEVAGSKLCVSEAVHQDSFTAPY